MEHGRITAFCAAVLLVSCLVLSGILISLNERSNVLDGGTAENLIGLLAQSGIDVPYDIVTGMSRSGTVYVCNSEDYDVTVAALLADSEVEAVYSTPDGEIVLLENGSRVDFEGSFRFHYYRDGSGVTGETTEQTVGPDGIGDHPDDGRTEEITAVVSEFLARGSGAFIEGGVVRAVTEVGAAWESRGAYYVLAHRSIDGISVADNAVLCKIENGEVEEAYGIWSFLVPGESYGTELCDSINLLLALKKEIETSGTHAEDTGRIAVRSVTLCYSLYFYGDGEDLCLIPCWQIDTEDENGIGHKYIYNAIDCTLYIK